MGWWNGTTVWFPLIETQLVIVKHKTSSTSNSPKQQSKQNKVCFSKIRYTSTIYSTKTILPHVQKSFCWAMVVLPGSLWDLKPSFHWVWLWPFHWTLGAATKAPSTLGGKEHSHCTQNGTNGNGHQNVACHKPVTTAGCNDALVWVWKNWLNLLRCREWRRDRRGCESPFPVLRP